MIVAVVGKGRDCPFDTWRLAKELGKMIGRRGDLLVTGGLAGVMDAAAAGAVEVGGDTLGLLPAGREREASKHLTMAVPTGLHEYQRNALIGTCCDAMLACFGSHGTLQELAVALDRGIPVAEVETYRWEALGVERLSLAEVDGWLESIK